MNMQQNYSSIGLFVHKFYVSNSLEGAVSEWMGVLHCEEYCYEELFLWNIGSSFVWTFLHMENGTA